MPGAVNPAPGRDRRQSLQTCTWFFECASKLAPLKIELVQRARFQVSPGHTVKAHVRFEVAKEEGACPSKIHSKHCRRSPRSFDLNNNGYVRHLDKIGR
jgi:hypothetical protein